MGVGGGGDAERFWPTVPTKTKKTKKEKGSLVIYEKRNDGKLDLIVFNRRGGGKGF